MREKKNCFTVLNKKMVHNKYSRHSKHGGFGFSAEEKVKIDNAKKRLSQGFSNIKNKISNKITDVKKRYSDWRENRIYDQAANAIFAADRQRNMKRVSMGLRDGSFGSHIGGRRKSRHTSRGLAQDRMRRSSEPWERGVHARKVGNPSYKPVMRRTKNGTLKKVYVLRKKSSKKSSKRH